MIPAPALTPPTPADVQSTPRATRAWVSGAPCAGAASRASRQAESEMVERDFAVNDVAIRASPAAQAFPERHRPLGAFGPQPSWRYFWGSGLLPRARRRKLARRAAKVWRYARIRSCR